MTRDLGHLRWRSAFTLVEVLAIVVLLSMATAAGMVSLAGAGETARWAEAASIVRGLDARARLEGRQGRPCRLQADHDGYLVLTRPDDYPTRVELPFGFTVRFLHVNATEIVDVIEFDRRGRSTDYTVDIERGDRHRLWGVSGTTGWTGMPVETSS